MKNVAIVGRFCSGKTTLANVLVDEYGFKKVSMADNMKNIVREVYGTLDKNEMVQVTLRDGNIVRRSIREVLQTLGEAVKDADRDIWLKWFEADLMFVRGPFVMDDMRLLFEAEALRETGWVIVALNCPEPVRMERYFKVYGKYPTMAEMNHKTETESGLITADVILDATLSPEYLAAVVAGMASEVGDEM
jgi:dephospho-CoA kinase